MDVVSTFSRHQSVREPASSTPQVSTHLRRGLERGLPHPSVKAPLELTPPRRRRMSHCISALTRRIRARQKVMESVRCWLTVATPFDLVGRDGTSRSTGVAPSSALLPRPHRGSNTSRIGARPVFDDMLLTIDGTSAGVLVASQLT